MSEIMCWSDFEFGKNTINSHFVLNYKLAVVNVEETPMHVTTPQHLFINYFLSHNEMKINYLLHYFTEKNLYLFNFMIAIKSIIFVITIFGIFFYSTFIKGKYNFGGVLHENIHGHICTYET